MRKKSLPAILIIALCLALLGLGDIIVRIFDSSNSSVANSEVTAANTSGNSSEPTRFSATRSDIQGLNLPSRYLYHDSYIITDNETGKQYLYIFTSREDYGEAYTAAIVELGDTTETSNH